MLCKWTGLTSFLAVCFNTLGPALNGNYFGYTSFLLLHRLSAEETMSTRPTHDLLCNWTGLTSFLAVCFNTLGPALNGNFGYTSVILLNDKCREVKRTIAS